MSLSQYLYIVASIFFSNFLSQSLNWLLTVTVMFCLIFVLGFFFLWSPWHLLLGSSQTCCKQFTYYSLSFSIFYWSLAFLYSAILLFQYHLVGPNPSPSVWICSCCFVVLWGVNFSLFKYMYFLPKGMAKLPCLVCLKELPCSLYQFSCGRIVENRCSAVYDKWDTVIVWTIVFRFIANTVSKHYQCSV